MHAHYSSKLEAHTLAIWTTTALRLCRHPAEVTSYIKMLPQDTLWRYSGDPAAIIKFVLTQDSEITDWYYRYGHTAEDRARYTNKATVLLNKLITEGYCEELVPVLPQHSQQGLLMVMNKFP